MLTIILEIYKEAANPKLAEGMRAYMKNRFDFFGIQTPVRRGISKSILHECKSLSKSETIALAKKLWKRPERECHYLAQELLCQNIRKNIELEDIEWMEYFVLNNSWWDTVDVVAPKLMALYFKNFPKERKRKIKEWIASKNTWLIRSAILFQLKYKEETDVELLFDTILKTCHTKEFFINKAIGWILRENAKREPELIYDFIEENKSLLAPLSVREGLKHVIG